MFAIGKGLPGRIWQAGQPTWIIDVVQEANFPAWRRRGEGGIARGIRVSHSRRY